MYPPRAASLGMTRCRACVRLTLNTYLIKFPPTQTFSWPLPALILSPWPLPTVITRPGGILIFIGKDKSSVCRHSYMPLSERTLLERSSRWNSSDQTSTPLTETRGQHSITRPRTDSPRSRNSCWTILNIISADMG